MERCTHEVRLHHWKNIILQSQSRNDGQTVAGYEGYLLADLLFLVAQNS